MLSDCGLTMADITYVSDESGDWAAVFVDGEVYYQGHSIPAHIWCYLLEAHELTSDLGDDGQFPEKLVDAQKWIVSGSN